MNVHFHLDLDERLPGPLNVPITYLLYRNGLCSFKLVGQQVTGAVPEANWQIDEVLNE